MFPEQALDAPRLGRIPQAPCPPDPLREAVTASILSRGLPLDLLNHPDHAVGAITASGQSAAAEPFAQGLPLATYASEESDDAPAGAFVLLRFPGGSHSYSYTADDVNPHRVALAVILSALGLPAALIGSPRYAALEVIEAARRGS